MAVAEDNCNVEQLVKIELDDAVGPRRSAEAEQERAIAIYDILEENQFVVPEHIGPFHLYLKLEGRHVHFDIRNAADIEIAQFFMALGPLRRVIRDYFHVVTPITMPFVPNHHRKFRLLIWARALHNEGSELLQSRLKGKVIADFKIQTVVYFDLCIVSKKGETNE